MEEEKVELEFPLVSILVITYNSSQYVLETLESTKQQVYSNKELIISDDCSTDNTVSICEKWLEQNNDAFVSTTLTVLPQNKGIPSNCNNGLTKCKGEWVKLIAGDDMLLPSCLTVNINFVLNKNFKFIFSLPKIKSEAGDQEFEKKREQYHRSNGEFYNLSAKKQFLHLLVEPYPMNPPTIFFNRKAILSMGGFDERFPNEDFPLYLKATSKGYKLCFIPEQTIIYRIHESSIRRTSAGDGAVSHWQQLRLERIISEYIHKELVKNYPLTAIEFYNQLYYSRFIVKLGNKVYIKNALSIFRYFSPLFILRRLRNLRKKLPN